MRISVLLALLASVGLGQQTDSLWIQTATPGARVFVNGQEKGPAPYFAGPIAAGTYRVRVVAPGHVDWHRAVTIPAKQSPIIAQLEAKADLCKITSEPIGAAVWWQDQLLGTTPLYIQAFPAGEHTFVFVESGYVHLQQTVEITLGQEQSVHGVMAADTGTITVRGLPPGANVLVDGVARGTLTAAAPGQPGITAPLTLHGFRRKAHTVSLSYHGTSSEAQTLDLSNGVAECFISLYVPDTTVVLKSGRSVACMLLEKRPDQSILVATGETTADHHLISADQIKQISKLPQQ